MKSIVLIALAAILFVDSGTCFGQTYWSTITAPTKNSIKLRSVTYGSGLFVAVGDSGRIITSPNGFVWTACSVSTKAPFYCVYFCKDTFCTSSDKYYFSSDGLNWKGGYGVWQKVYAIASTSLGYGLNLAFLSNYGIDWCIACADGPGCSVSGAVTLINKDNLLVAVGNNGLIVTSTSTVCYYNGYPPYTIMCCNKWNVDTAYNFSSIAYGNGKYVAIASTKKWDTAVIGGTGRSWVLTSEDLKTWVKTDSFSTYYNTAAYLSGRFVIVGFNGLVAVSSDGTSWSKKQVYNVGLNSVTWGPAPNNRWQFVAVGDQGLIMTSLDDNPVPVENKNVKRNEIPKINVTLGNGRLLVKLPPSFSGGPLTVQLFNISGRKVGDFYLSPQNGQLNIPVSGYSAGVYQLSISGNGNRFARTVTIPSRFFSMIKEKNK